METVTPILKPDQAAMHDHLAMLFKRALTGRVEITAIRVDRDGERTPPRARFFDVDELDEAAEYAASVNAEHLWNVYVGAAARIPDVFPGKPATDEDFHRVWAIHADVDDDHDLEAVREKYRALGITPPIVVVTGRTPTTRAQLWWPLIDPITDADVYRRTLRAVASVLRTDPAVTAAKQLMRLAGGVNWPKKDGRVLEKTEVIHPSQAQQAFSLEQLHRAFPLDAPSQAQEHADERPGTLLGALAARDLRSALASMRSDDRDLWVRMGHALKELGEQGRGLWIEWSQTSDKYDPIDAARVWESFHPSRTGYQAVFAEAQRQGWVNPGSGAPHAADVATPEVNTDDPVFDPWEEFPGPTFPLDCLPPRIRGFVEQQARSIGADVSAVAMAALAACSGAIDHRFSLKMKRTGDWYAHPRLWVMLVGPPSAKKTPVLNAALRPLRAAERAVERAYRADLARHQERKDAGEKEPAPPPPTRYIANDVTSEKLGDLLKDQDRGILVEHDEISGWIGSMEKYGGGKGSAADRGFWLQAYNGGPKRIDRIGRGSIYVENCSASFLGGVQNKRLAELSNLSSDGLLQRFLPVMMKRPSFPDEIEDDGSAQVYDDTLHALMSMKPAAQVMTADAMEEAKRFQRFTFDIEQMPGLGDSFCSFVGKLPGVHGALTLVLHLTLDPANTMYEPVELRTVQAASRILQDFIIPHAVMLYQESADKVDWELLRKLAGYVLTSGKERFTPSDFTSGVRGLRGASVFEVAQKVSPLIAGGWLVEEEGRGGAPAWGVRVGLRDVLSERRNQQIAEQANTMKTFQRLRKGPSDE